MFRNMKKYIVMSLLFFMASAAAIAQETPRADTRQKAQRVRIAHGTANGELTRAERAALKRQQRHIRRTERRAKADGDVTLREKAMLERKQDRASRNIRRAKHNRLDRN
jgi:hypothetical protein